MTRPDHRISQKKLTKKEATVLGHLRQTRQGVWSTKQPHHKNSNRLELDPSSSNSTRIDDVFFKVADLTGKIYIDQTGRFPVISSKGKQYILVVYHYDSNTIYAETLKPRTYLALTAAYEKIHKLLTERSLQPKLHILDNECPDGLKTFMHKVNGIF